MPAEIALERMAERDHFHRLVGRPVVGRGRIPLQNQLPGGPDVDEIRRHPAAVRRHDPRALHIGGDQIDRVRDDQRKADQLPLSKPGNVPQATESAKRAPP